SYISYNCIQLVLDIRIFSKLEYIYATDTLKSILRLFFHHLEYITNTFGGCSMSYIGDVFQILIQDSKNRSYRVVELANCLANDIVENIQNTRAYIKSNIEIDIEFQNGKLEFIRKPNEKKYRYEFIKRNRCDNFETGNTCIL
ncbi:MAG: hypothetical protein MHPSP_003642, partial [Paramarteilia canceri]